jgi:hypothetical protein
MQLAAGGALGLAYAKLLALAPRTTLLAGAFLGLLHATIAGVLLAALPVFLPAMAVAAPGLLMIERGAPAAALFVLAHVAFGMLMSMWALPHRPVASGLGALGRAAMASDAA